MNLAGVLDPGPVLRGTSHDAELTCVVEGRISNRDSLARELGLDPVQPQEEVLAAAYRRFGDLALGRLRGDFAILVWDPRGRRALLARDQLGGRPLYIHRAGGRLVFASDLPALLDLLAVRPGPDRTAVLHWISGLAPPDGRTFFTGVRALGPGRVLVLDPRGCEQRSYWMPRYVTPEQAPRGEQVARVRSAVAAAVGSCAEHSERLGVLLSGGLDSSSIAAVACRRPGTGAYSAVFPHHASVDESELIGALTAHLSLDATRMTVRGGSMLWGALAHAARWQMPLQAQNLYFWRPLFRRAARDGVDVMLDGEGGDLIFAAARELMADRLLAARPADAVRLARALPGPGDRSLPAVLRLVRAHGARAALPPGLHGVARRARRSARHAPPWLSGADARLLRAGDGDLRWKRLDGPRWWARLADSLTAGLEATGIREQQYRRAQLAGIDGRSPLLDLELVELMLRMPPELSFGPALSRPLQREAMAGAVPDAIRLRPGKSYFDELFQRSLAVDDLAAVRRLLSAPDCELGAYLDAGRMRADLFDVSPGRHPLGPRHWVKSAWRLVTAECWLREQSGSGFAERLLADERLRELDYLFPTCQPARVRRD